MQTDLDVADNLLPVCSIASQQSHLVAGKTRRSFRINSIWTASNEAIYQAIIKRWQAFLSGLVHIAYTVLT